MNYISDFCNNIKRIIDSYPNMNIDGAREIIKEINDYLYTTHQNIGKLSALGKEFSYFSDFHKFWRLHHKEILDCQIDVNKCIQVAEKLHEIYVLTNGSAFKSVWNTCGLTNDDVCRIRLLTANQDFRGSRKFSDLAKVFNSDNGIFDEKVIKDDPGEFLKSIHVGTLSQNDKRIKYAKNIAEFVLNHNCKPINLINKFNNDIYALRQALIDSNSGYGNKKADMFLRDMVVLGIWPKVSGFDKLNVASDINTIKVALRTGIIHTKIPLVSSFLDIFCYQYDYIDNMNVLAWRKVWEQWIQRYPKDNIASPCLLDYFIYNVVGKQFCKESLAIFLGDNCGHTFRWASSQNRRCQVCWGKGKNNKAHLIGKVMPCKDKEGYKAILQTDFNRNLPKNKQIKSCPFVEICGDNKHLMPPKSISILGQTGWQSAYTNKNDGGGGLMA